MSSDKNVSTPKIRIVAREDRASEFAGVRLLLASLERWSPNVPVSLYATAAEIEGLSSELLSIHPGLTLVPFEHDGGWACKPFVLLDALDSAEDDEIVMWLDTDIIVLRPVEELAFVDSEMIVTAEETNPNPNLDIEKRQATLGIPVGSARETTISSSVVGVRKKHRKVIEAWAAGVDTEEFKQEQRLPLHERLFFGDQEVWEAVLCSSDNRDIPVKILRNFNEMLQGTYTSYVPEDQTKGLVAPLFVHATGNLKPWRQSRLRVAQEVFPYFDCAQPYLQALKPEERPYFAEPSLLGRVVKSIGFEPYAMMRRLHHRVSSLRFRIPQFGAGFLHAKIQG